MIFGLGARSSRHPEQSPLGFNPASAALGLLAGGGSADIQDVSRGLAGFSPELRDRVLQCWGRTAAEELISIASERNPQLFYESLLAFGVRQEQAGHAELAGRVYAAVAENAGAANDAVGVGPRARERLDAILGQGSVGPRAEFLLRRLAQESCEPTALLAMGGAGALFKVARLGVLSRLAASPTANIFTRGFGARAIASLAAFSLEAPAFTLTGHLANSAIGRNQDWSHLGSEIASGYLVLGGMRLAGWAANTVGMGLRVRPVQILNQTGMLGGILLGHRLEESFGLRERRDGATTLIDSLALLLQFNIAGNLTRHAFGARFQAWEQGLEAQTQGLGRTPSFPWRLDGDTPMLAENIPSSWVVGSHEPGSEPLRNRPLLMAIGGDGNNGGKGRNEGSDPPVSAPPSPESRRRTLRDATLPFITVMRPEKGEADSPGGRDPLQVESAIQLVRRIQDPKLKFRQTLQDEDLHFQLQSPAREDLAGMMKIERFLPAILQYLNAASIGGSIPVGRQVIIEVLADGVVRQRYSFIKGAQNFECSPPLPGQASESSEPQAKPTQVPRSGPELSDSTAREPSSRSLANAEGEGTKLTVEEEEARAIPLRAQVLDTLPRYLELAAKQAKRLGVPGLIILEKGDYTLQDMEQQTAGFGRELPEGTVFKLFLPEAQRSFRAVVEAQRLRWEEFEDKGWQYSTLFSAATVRSVLELYQTLAVHAKSKVAPSSHELVLRYRGPNLSPDFFAEFILSTLERFPALRRERIKIEFASGEPELTFSRQTQNRWGRE